MKLFISTLVSLLFTLNTYATVVAIIDSGTDHQHKDLSHLMWKNQAEAPHGQNYRDEDGNGYEDDIFGWNFAEDNSEVIAGKYRGMLNNDIRKFLATQEKMIRNTVTSDEIAWSRKMVKNPDFLKKLLIYGNFMHGTHVAGISVKGNPKAQILAVKLTATEIGLSAGVDKANDVHESPLVMGEINPIVDKILKRLIDELVKQQNAIMIEVAAYVGNHKADIANGSFGRSYQLMEGVFAGIIAKVIRRELTAEEKKKYTMYFFEKTLIAGKRFVGAAPNTLFVFAAGNEGLNNDEYPTSPANIVADNVISVAATLDRDMLAFFSNYGTGNVDVAAPGVGIYSTVPDDEYIGASGTSQAAPFVSRVASLVKDNNPALKPAEIKTIVMGTVDKKGWLAMKVKSGGIVNQPRAVEAAELSKTMTVEEAIKVSITKIADVKSNSNKLGNKRITDLDAFVFPLPSPFSFRK